MISLQRLFGAALIVIGSSNSAAQIASGTDDALLRAAYCVGVLKKRLQRGEDDAFFASTCRAKWSSWGFTSFEACSAQFAELSETAHKALEEKHSRYARYVTVRLMELIDIPVTLPGIVTLGERDQAATEAKFTDQRYVACRDGCAGGSDAQCIVECSARYDQILSNVLRCLILPDGLPF